MARYIVDVKAESLKSVGGLQTELSSTTHDGLRVRAKVRVGVRAGLKIDCSVIGFMLDDVVLWGWDLMW